MKKIPVIDLAGLGLDNKGEIVDQKRFGDISKELDQAFSGVGFAYVKNHGVEPQAVEQLFESSRIYFNLPQEAKNKQPWDINTFEGYTGQDREVFDSKANQHEIREAYDITSCSGLCPQELYKPINILAPQLCRLTNSLLDCMSVPLGLEQSYLRNRHRFMFTGNEKNGTILRSLYYPPLADEDVRPGVIRCGEHSDYGTITLLLQDDMGGLEVLSGSDWISATPIPGTILINLGDLMQFWTSGRYRATVHRVRVPAEELKRRSTRQSIAFFVNPDNGVLVQPLDETSDVNHPPVEALEYLKRRLLETYQY